MQLRLRNLAYCYDLLILRFVIIWAQLADFSSICWSYTWLASPVHSGAEKTPLKSIIAQLQGTKRWYIKLWDITSLRECEHNPQSAGASGERTDSDNCRLLWVTNHRDKSFHWLQCSWCSQTIWCSECESLELSCCLSWPRPLIRTKYGQD